MTRNARRAGLALKLPDELLQALARLEGGPLDSGPVVRRIAAGVTRLNRGLTRERDGFAAYLRDPELRAAYRTYYLSTNAPKLWPILDRLQARGLLPAGGRALELGCGPGTGAIGLHLWAREAGVSWRCRATDALPEAIACAKETAAALDLPLETAVADLSKPLSLDGPFDLVMSLNVINELSPRHDARLADDLAAILAPGGLWIVVEPAAAEPSRRVLVLRDLALQRGWHVLAPCPSQHACPALAAADGWCHGEWHFERPAFMRAVDQQTGLRRDVLKATWFVLSRAPAPPVTDGLPGRVVSARRDQKGRSDVFVCAGGAIRHLELQTRDRTEANADFFDLSRHDLVSLSGPGVAAGATRLGAGDRVSRLEEGG